MEGEPYILFFMERTMLSFFSGTTLMYPMVDKEAKEAGLSDENAARFALGVAGLVSTTEGVALEWIDTNCPQARFRGMFVN